MATTTEPVTITLDNFIRADTDMYFGKTVEDGGLGKLRHRRQMAEIMTAASLPIGLRSNIYDSPASLEFVRAPQ
jgi:hypothetical protein